MIPRRVNIAAASAFTLVELLIVVVIIAAMMASLSASLTGRADQRQLEAVAKDLCATILHGRRDAVAIGQPCRVMFADDMSAYWLEAWSPAEQRFTPARGAAGLKRPLAPVQVADMGDAPGATATPLALTFNPDGTGYSGTLTLALPRQSPRKIEVLASSTQAHVLP